MAKRPRRAAKTTPPQLKALGKVKPPMGIRASTMQMPSMQNLALRQPMLGRGAVFPKAARVLPNPLRGVGLGGELTAKGRQSLKSSQFALPGKGEGKSGKGSGSYPIPDASHARNALARVSQHGSSQEKAQVRAKVKARFPNIGQK